MDFNYHTHTYRCSHASGTEEEYIKRAIENGIKYMGFSDHFPYICRDGYEASFRVPVEKAADYIDTISALREKYKNDIEIKIGFEMEYYPENFEYMFTKAKEYSAEYLILGEHFIKEEHPDSIPVSQETKNEEFLHQYATNVISAIKSGVFTYVAHPDVINFVGDEKIFDEQMRRICVASREYNVPLEINCLGIRDKRYYPRDDFWKIVGQEGSPVTIGFDAHDVMSAFDGESLKTAEKLIQKYNLNFIGKPELRLIQEKQKK